MNLTELATASITRTIAQTLHVIADILETHPELDAPNFLRTLAGKITGNA